MDPGTYVSAGLRWLWAGELSLFAGADGGLSLEPERGNWLSGYGGGRWSSLLGDHFETEITLSGGGFQVQAPDRFEALLLRADPTLAARWGNLRWELRLHGGIGRNVYGESQVQVDEDTWQRGLGLGLGSSIGSFTLRGFGDLYESHDGTYYNAGVAAVWERSRVRIQLSHSWWDTPFTSGEHLILLQLDLPLGTVVQSSTSAGKSSPDPLLGTRSSTYLSSGLRLSLLEALRRPEVPVVRILEESPRKARFVVQVPEAQSVELLGDFSSWDPVAMESGPEGQWVVEIEVAPGLYHFGFRVDGTWWVPDGSPGRTQDEWGRSTGTLVVPGA